jgi:hypothetical protein
MFKAEVSSIMASVCDRALFSDAGQVSEPVLLEELSRAEADMIIISERSFTGGLSDDLLDEWRKQIER